MLVHNGGGDIDHIYPSGLLMEIHFGMKIEIFFWLIGEANFNLSQHIN